MPHKLVIFQPFAERRGGSDNVLLTFLRHRDPDRFDPLVVFFGEGDFEVEVAALGVRTRALPPGRLRNPLFVVASSARARNLLRAERPDLILNWLSTAHLLAGPGVALAGMADRCVWWQQDLVAARARGPNRVADWIGHARATAIDRAATAIPAAAIGCCSESVREAQQRLRPRRPTLAVLPGIDPPQGLPQSELAGMRREAGIPEDALVVGIVGRLFAWKGHHLLLAALAELRRTHPSVHGLFVGGGGHRGDAAYERRLRTIVRDSGLEGAVTFTGQVPNATAYIQLMDIFVNASSPEPFGLVLLEAMALGVPVVAVAAAGPTEIVESGRSGLLTPTNQPTDLAAGVGALLADPNLRSRLADGGRERYRSRFGSERMAREMEDRLEGLIP